MTYYSVNDPQRAAKEGVYLAAIPMTYRIPASHPTSFYFLSLHLYPSLSLLLYPYYFIPITPSLYPSIYSSLHTSCDDMIWWLMIDDADGLFPFPLSSPSPPLLLLDRLRKWGFLNDWIGCLGSTLQAYKASRRGKRVRDEVSINEANFLSSASHPLLAASPTAAPSVRSALPFRDRNG